MYYVEHIYIYENRREFLIYDEKGRLIETTTKRPQNIPRPKNPRIYGKEMK